MTGTIGVFGASGFVGSALCERMFFVGGYDFVPYVRSSGNAGRIARLPVNIRLLDLMDRPRVFEAVKECDIVVNCALGSGPEFQITVDNLIAAARAARVRKFIHLSSITIYGLDPASDSVDERGRPSPGPNSYGVGKLKQDQGVFALHAAGIPTFILVPGNIVGPYSTFLRGMVQRLSAGSIPLVDGGRYASNLIHVDNLVEAILTAARADSGSGQRYFVNETEPVSWRRVFDDFARRLDFQMTYLDVPRDRVVPHIYPESSASSSGIGAHMRVLLSADFRRAASMLPAFDWANQTAYSLFKRLPPARQAEIRERLRGPVRLQKPSSDVRLDERYVTVQARRYYHSTSKLQALGWRPPLNYAQGVESMVSWLRFAGIGCEAERLDPLLTR